VERVDPEQAPEVGRPGLGRESEAVARIRAVEVHRRAGHGQRVVGGVPGFDQDEGVDGNDHRLDARAARLEDEAGVDDQVEREVDQRLELDVELLEAPSGDRHRDHLAGERIPQRDLEPRRLGGDGRLRRG